MVIIYVLIAWYYYMPKFGCVVWQLQVASGMFYTTMFYTKVVDQLPGILSFFRRPKKMAEYSYYKTHECSEPVRPGVPAGECWGFGDPTNAGNGSPLYGSTKARWNQNPCYLLFTQSCFPSHITMAWHAQVYMHPLLKIFNQCNSLTGVGDVIPYWRSLINEVV